MLSIDFFISISSQLGLDLTIWCRDLQLPIVTKATQAYSTAEFGCTNGFEEMRPDWQPFQYIPFGEVLPYLRPQLPGNRERRLVDWCASFCVSPTLAEWFFFFIPAGRYWCHRLHRMAIYSEQLFTLHTLRCSRSNFIESIETPEKESDFLEFRQTED